MAAAFERMGDAEELFALFQQTRLAPLGNTFLKADSAAEPAPARAEAVVRRRRSIQMKACTIPEYIPHQLVSIYGDSDIFEDVNTDENFISTVPAMQEKKAAKDLSPTDEGVPELTRRLAAPARYEPAFVGRSNSDQSDISEPAFVDALNIDNVRMGRNPRAELDLSNLPPAPGLELPVKSARWLELGLEKPSTPPVAAKAEAPAKNNSPSSTPSGPITTLMIRNLPHELLQSQLAAEIDTCGFEGLYDFLYMPSTFGTGRGKGYAFVNFATPEVADCFSTLWHNTCRFGNPNEHVLLNVSVACIQGRDANVARWDTSKMRRIRNANHRPLVTVLMSDMKSTPPMKPPAEQARTRAPCALPTLATSPAPPCRMATKTAFQTTLAKAQAESDDENHHNMVGKWCKINGLQRMTHANGLWGMVEAYDETLERYIMRVPVDGDHWFMAKILRDNIDLPTTSR
mmetsp:Transcript_17985/g.46373  ORF Transcript_17985/g.46373 Transcript_17985/m.46373 type:complete len:459 (-) Transcript_17985:486-1862(-)|eukprot:CAMPEP_0195095358 /NCGR_PEP_ID=MMETSP0448-20130528/46800_1 /TAXON_ID=66468 /ORGANISM="Heterocapsa triquestra, Strain CCMP 448" /LENGTH=458 /DNA_ID=CAMNT_0040129555 /DNA_START=80 /DNA_END=1456 /DNA_ORIENTATION=-